MTDLSDLHLAVDVDGTLAHHYPVLCKIVREEFNVPLNVSDITKWDFELAEHTGYTPDPEPHVQHNGHPITFGDVVGYAYQQNDVLLDMEPLDGAIETVNALYNDVGKLSIVTHRSDFALDATKEWLQNHGVQYDEFIGNAPSDKSEVGADMLVDDHARNAEDMANAGKTGILILTHANHRKVPAHPNVKTASDVTGTPTERLVTNHKAQWNHIETIVKNEKQTNEKMTV